MADAKLTSKGQITIPKEVRDYLKLRAGDSIRFDLQPNGRVVLRSRNVRLMDLCGALKRPGQKPVSIEEMNRAIAEAAADSAMKGL